MFPVTALRFSRASLAMSPRKFAGRVDVRGLWFLHGKSFQTAIFRTGRRPGNARRIRCAQQASRSFETPQHYSQRCWPPI